MDFLFNVSHGAALVVITGIPYERASKTTMPKFSVLVGRINSLLIGITCPFQFRLQDQSKKHFVFAFDCFVF